MIIRGDATRIPLPYCWVRWADDVFVFVVRAVAKGRLSQPIQGGLL